MSRCQLSECSGRMETLGKSIASVGERLDRVNSNSCGQSSLKVSDTVHVFIQQVQGDRNVIFCPLSERPYLNRQQRMIASLIPLSFLSLDSVAERLLNQVAEDSQTRLVSACTLPGSPCSLLRSLRLGGLAGSCAFER